VRLLWILELLSRTGHYLLLSSRLVPYLLQLSTSRMGPGGRSRMERFRPLSSFPPPSATTTNPVDQSYRDPAMMAGCCEREWGGQAIRLILLLFRSRGVRCGWACDL